MIATGQVVGPAAQPIERATIKLTPLGLDFGGTDRIGECVGRAGFPATSVVSDASGRFAARLQGIPDNSRVCVAAEVTPPAQSNLSPAIATAGPLQFKVPEAGVVLDSAKFQIVLSAKT